MSVLLGCVEEIELSSRVCRGNEVKPGGKEIGPIFHLWNVDLIS